MSPRSLVALLGWCAVVACNALVDAPGEFRLRTQKSDAGTDNDTGPDDTGPDAGSVSVAVDDGSPWPMLGGNRAHTGRSEIVGSSLRSSPSLANKTKSTRALRFTNIAPPSAGPAVDRDGTAYFTTVAGKLMAFRADGTHWSRDLGGRTRCTPALASGVVYATAEGAGLAALSRDGGTEKWRVPVGGGSHPVVGADGTVYVIDAVGVHAIQATGTARWIYPLGPAGAPREEAVAIDDDGTIYAVRDGLHAIAPSTGERLWHVADGDDASPPPVAAGGMVLVGTGTKIVAIDVAKRQRVWENAVTPRLRASPSVARNGIVYIVQGGQLTTASLHSGEYNFEEATLGTRSSFTPLVDGRSYAYAANGGNDLGSVWVFDLARPVSGEIWTLGSGEEPVGFAIGSDGTIYVAASSAVGEPFGELIAIPK